MCRALCPLSVSLCPQAGGFSDQTGHISQLRYGYSAAFAAELLFCGALVFVFLFMAQKCKRDLSPSFGIANAGVTIAGVQSLVRVRDGASESRRCNPA